MKGVYPREPNNRKKAQKGKLAKKTLYYVKDIKFLMHEPLIWKFREFKVFMRKIKTAMSKGDKATADRLKENKPTLQLDHLVKERYVNIYLQYNIVHLIILFLLLLDTPHLMMP